MWCVCWFVKIIYYWFYRKWFYFYIGDVLWVCVGSLIFIYGWE